MTRQRVPVGLPAVVMLALLAHCVPADESISLGSVSFHVGASRLTASGIPADLVVDGWSVEFDRILLGYKTMTIGEIGQPDTCAYRGRGAMTNLVIDPRVGTAQTFNGLKPVDCPDVGVILGAPDGATGLGDRVQPSDLFELAADAPAHAIIEATLRQQGRFDTTARTYHLKLRFETENTPTRFGGCREALKGVRIVANQRDEVPVLFAAENLFRDAISSSSHLRVGPIVDADSVGNDDGVITMSELEGMSLRRIPYEFYSLPDRGRSGSLADYLRELFRFTFQFRTDTGLCVGNEPGSE